MDGTAGCWKVDEADDDPWKEAWTGQVSTHDGQVWTMEHYIRCEADDDPLNSQDTLGRQ